MSCLKILRLLKIWLLFGLICLVNGDDFSSAPCPAECDCKWHTGYKAAMCENLNNNPLYEIVQEAFQNVGLSNLKKLHLRNCSLQSIHKKGLSNLKIVMELDLSRNQIITLHPDTFIDNENLRFLYLNKNYIEILEDGLFKNMTFLQKVDISENRIFKIGTKAFTLLPKLRILILHGNNLTVLRSETFNSLQDLSSLSLSDNPWKCDCDLQEFRNYVMDRNLYTPPTSCAEPSQVAKRQWNELESKDFACEHVNRNLIHLIMEEFFAM